MTLGDDNAWGTTRPASLIKNEEKTAGADIGE